MNKFEYMDIVTSLDAIMRQNTAFYQSDFEIDKEILQKAAASPNAEDKTLLWFRYVQKSDQLIKDLQAWVLSAVLD